MTDKVEMKHTIRLHPLGKELTVNDQTPLIDLLHEYGVEFPCGGKGTCGKCQVRLLEGEIGVTDLHRQKLAHFKLPADRRLACMSNCTGPITLHIEQFDHLILADETEFEFIPQEGFGVAVDLGTTTIVTQLVDLKTAQILAVETIVNPQVKFGADLISRIQAGLDGHSKEMTGIIRSAIGHMIGMMLQGRNLPLDKVVLVGNTVMQRSFSDLDLRPLSCYPFQVDDLGSKTFTAEELGWAFRVTGKIEFFPSIGSFVGSDILAGIAATGLYRKDRYTALIDLGTNGEIAVGNKDHIICASTAAGPAFEGANLSMGMRAVTGAISSLRLEGSKIVATTIGNTRPKGICGSALIDAVAVLLKLDLIGMFGEIGTGEDRIQVHDNIWLTQKDLYEFLLAKSAIAAGIEILTKQLGISPADLDEIYIAGGFGNYIHIEHLLSTGMIESKEEKIHKMGNTALIGAKMFLFDNQGIVSEILGKTQHVNLEGFPEFQDTYISKMNLIGA
ncbi:MAG: ASKHA domain-containing protein [Prolixibacteraceae bacterium]